MIKSEIIELDAQGFLSQKMDIYRTKVKTGES